MAVAPLLVAALLVTPRDGAATLRKTIHFERITTIDGLSQGTVLAIEQDRTGFIWFGTQDGLNRFDGYEFRVFGEDPDDPHSLPRSWIWALEVDRRGDLWIGTDGGGLSRWDPSTEGFITFHHDPDDPASLADDVVRVLFEDREGRLWIGTDGGLSLLDGERRSFRRYTHDPDDPASLSHDRVRAIAQDGRGRIWVGTDGGGLDRFDPASGGFVHFRHDPRDAATLAGDRVGSLMVDRDGRLWVGTLDRGLSRLDPESEAFESFRHDPADPLSLGQDRVRTLYEDRRGHLWIGTDDGLDEWLPDAPGIRHHLHSPDDPASLVDDSVSSIFEDRGGVLWIGSARGLSRWNPTTGAFGAYSATRGDRSRLTGDTITAFAEAADGSLWVGTYEGLNHIDTETGEVTRFVERAGGLVDDRVMALAVDRRDLLWIGTYDRGLQRYDRRRGRFTRFRHDPQDPASLGHDSIAVLTEDRSGSLWVGTYGGGLDRYDPASGRFVHYRHDPQSAESLASDRVMALLEDSLGYLWVGTDGGGLSGLPPRRGGFVNVRAGSGGLTSDLIWALHEDREGDLWIGTGRHGLARWRRGDRLRLNPRFERYTVKEGLPNNVVYAILEDDSGLLWVATNRGLARLDRRTGACRTFDVASGLLSNEFNFGAFLETRSGEMFFGTNHGFNFFDPATIQQNPHAPPVVLTSILKNNVPIEPRLRTEAQRELVLGRADHVLSFEFAALDYTAPDKIQYAYKLEGFDSTWMRTRGHRLATYTNLRPGNYTFRVKAANGDGVWNEDGVAVPVRVVRPLWRSWWAYTLYGLAAAALLLAYTWAQHRRIEKEASHARQLEREVERRTAELADRNRELEVANDKLQQASFTDSLTGLRNRRYLMYTIEDDIALVDRHYADIVAAGEPPAGRRPDFLFLIFDLDGFKDVNDTFGHAAGDRVLVQVKDILERACRRSDTVIRWGGDEFLIVGRYADRTAAEILSDRIRRAVAKKVFSLGPGVELRLSCSIGFAHYPFSTRSPTWLAWGKVLAIADRALYIAKNSGRNAWVGLHETPTTRELTTEELIHRVNEGVEQLVSDGYLELHSSIADEQELVWGWG